MDTCNWSLGNGNTLKFTVHDSNQDWKAVGGLYVFASLTEDGWLPLYIGKADDFSDRLPSHERLDEAIELGATHIHAAIVSSEANRDKWEPMLIQHYQPPLNVQHK